MKRVLLMVFSILLVLACLFSLFAGVAGVRDILNIKDYKQADADFARESLKTAREGIAQLKENEEVYLTGVGTYTDGLSQYAAGQKSYNDGQAALKEGEKTLAEGYAAYEAGKKAYAEGQAKIDANTQAYNEGKEKLAKIEPLMPYLNQYVQFRDGTIGKLPGFDNAQAWFVGVVRPIAKNLGIDIPADVTDFPAFMNQMVADGKAQLKEYEDGVAQLEAAKKQLAQAEQDLAAGEVKLADARQQLAAGANKLADARNQLADGKAQLSVFEEGEIALAEGGMALCEGMPMCFSYFNGRQTVKSLPEYLAIEFGVEIPDNLVMIKNGVAYLDTEAYEQFCITVLSSMYKVDENGEVVVKNGCKMLDLDKCSVLCDKAEQYLVDQEADITKEVIARIAIYITVGVAAILGFIGAVRGIVAAAKGTRKTGKTLGVISAVLALAGIITGICTHFGDYVYSVRLDEVGNYVGETAAKLSFAPVHQYSGTVQLAGLIVMGCATVLFAIFAILASKEAAAKEAALAAAAEDFDDDMSYAAAAAAAAAAVAEAEPAAPAAEEPVIEAAAEAEPEAKSDDETVKE